MRLKYIEIEKRKRVAWIRFNRPEKMNAVNHQVYSDLEVALMDCEKDPEIRVVILKGDDRAFIAGADIEEMATGDISVALFLANHVKHVQGRLASLAKPTIAAISGYALGGGCEIALCCDFRISSEGGVFGLPEITLGLIPGGGGTQRLPRLVGISAATRLLFLGEMISAEEAAKIGLVDKVVSKANLEAEVEGLAKKLIERPSLALGAIKAAMLGGFNMGLNEGLELEQQTFCMLFGTEDRKEGLTAFIEKRKPVFRGR